MIKNIIFDLGGVIYELDFQRFNQNLIALQGQSQPQEIYSRVAQPPVFTDYEKGTIDTPTFRERLRQELHLRATDADIDRAWNSLLVGVLPGRQAMLSSLKPHFNLALLSNINPLHLEQVKSECADIFQIFDRCFFSCELGTRKPEPEIFKLVLDRMGYLATETLFLDDSPPNVAAARLLGINAILVEEPQNLPLLLDQVTK